MAALLMVPITVAGKQHGLLALYRRRPQAFSAAEVDRARLVALQFAPLLERLVRDYVDPGLPGPANSA